MGRDTSAAPSKTASSTWCACSSAAEEALQQIDVVGQHIEQLVVIDSERLSVTRDRRAAAERHACEGFRHADRAGRRRAMAGSLRPSRRISPLEHVIERGGSVSLNRTLPAVSGTSRVDGRQIEQLVHRCALEQGILHAISSTFSSGCSGRLRGLDWLGCWVGV